MPEHILQNQPLLTSNRLHPFNPWDNHFIDNLYIKISTIQQPRIQVLNIVFFQILKKNTIYKKIGGNNELNNIMTTKTKKNLNSQLVNNLLCLCNISPCNEINKILSLMHLAERLKIELRHGKTSSNEQETVAAHSWRLALFVILCAPQISKPFDTEKAVTMALIHDLVEAEVGDQHFLKIDLKQTYEKEHQAILRIKQFLNNPTGDKLYNYWLEFEHLSTREAKIVKALDKIEGYIQQNEAQISTWTHEETVSVFYYLDKYCDFDPFLKTLKESVIQEAIIKLKKSNINVEALIEEAKEHQ